MKNLKFNHDAQSVLTFRKWGRKNYSSFLTVRKQVVISVLSVVYFLSTPVITMATVQDTSEVKMEYDLDEIEVSAQRTPALYSQVARIISVIESKEIEAAPAQSVQDLLEYVAAIDVRQRGTEGVQADVSVRGGTFDQTLILLNGINITDPQTGHHNLNLPVSLAQIERIEILEGPAARVYGPNAFSGAINIVTRQSAKSEISAALSGGSFGYFNGNLSGSFSTGKLLHMLAFNGKRSDGYTNNTDFDELNGFYSNQLNTEKGVLKFQLGLSEKGFGANSFYTPKYPNQYEATKTLFTSLKWEGNGPLHLTPVVYYRRHHDRFELYRTDKYALTDDGYNVWKNDTLPGWYGGHNYHMTNVYGANLNSWVKWAAGKTAFGIEFRREQIYSNTLGLDMDEPKDVPGEDEQFTKSDDRNTVSGFLEHAYYINDWTFTAGLMANYISGSDLGLNIFPGIDVSYNVSDAVKLYSSYNTSLRMPTFTDLYYDGPSNIGNPDLKPEKSATLEGGLKLRSKLVRGHAVIFYRHGKDIIDWVKEAPTSEIWQPQNLTEINNLGTELQAQFLLRNELGNRYPNVQISYLYNNLEKGDADFVSNYALDNLKQKLVGSISEQLAKGLTLDLRFVFQDREGSYTWFENKLPVGEVAYDSFWIFDGKLNYQRKQFTIFASVNNIFDKQYNDIGNVIQPGRWFKTGVIYKIGFN
ncbi:TonB-dependent receptor [Draconibacterium sp. IB214405]|uniref:TonB-dependent receptor plug domain-containing protein n=1 Tax=Draconibacterium sp. IB214405 TaxID=3097352 RepID=UPI002A1447E6|nr:TonB-dependent receptor [Draconibacterium sp. IB214405]MDX8341288.1 TonB-dependent receptor [Draconibacterium sp. IB214405]